jgi:hypothetical protein
VTRSDAELEIGGTGSVLAIWSILIVVIGAALFIYSLIVTYRGRRKRKRRRRPPPQQPGNALVRPMPPPPASRPLALPSGPTAGGVPLGRHMGGPRRPALPPGLPRPIPLPPGPGPRRFPHAPPPAALPSAGGPALPSGPVAGSGYGAIQPAGYGPATYGAPPQPAPTSYGTPAQGGPSYATPIPPPISSVPAISAASALYGTPAAIEGPRVTQDQPTQRVEPPRGKPGKLPKRGRPDECAALRAECEQLREVAANAAVVAAQAALDAESAHSDFVTAQRAADEARRAHEAIVRESTEIAGQMASLERTTTEVPESLQAETSHAAFAAYRRGDITSEQLREVFKRAEGWTPEHDRVSRRANELRAEEADALRTRDAAIVAEQAAGDRARTAAIAARNLDEQARTAAVDARGRCAAADACEQRGRRR